MEIARCVGVCALFSGIGSGLKEVRVRDENGMVAVSEALMAGHGGAIETVDIGGACEDDSSSMLSFLVEYMRSGRLESLRCVKLMELIGDCTEYTLVADALAEGHCPNLDALIADKGEDVGMDASLWGRSFELRDAVGGCCSLRDLRLLLSDAGPTELGLRALLSTRACAALEGLHLVFDSLSGDIVAPIAEYLCSARASSLQRLTIEVYYVEDEEEYPSWAPVWVALSSRVACNGLREVRLRGGDMGEEACVAFVGAIDAGALERVEVMSFMLVDFDLRAWMRVMRQVRSYTCEALREIHVKSAEGYYKITDVICTAVERARQNGMFPNLHMIDRVTCANWNSSDVDVSDSECEESGVLGGGEAESHYEVDDSY